MWQLWYNIRTQSRSLASNHHSHSCRGKDSKSGMCKDPLFEMYQLNTFQMFSSMDHPALVHTPIQFKQHSVLRKCPNPPSPISLIPLKKHLAVKHT